MPLPAQGAAAGPPRVGSGTADLQMPGGDLQRRPPAPPRPQDLFYTNPAQML